MYDIYVLIAIINYSIKVRALLLILTGVLLVEVVEVPFNSLLVWMLS
jgi:hypothetical protein